ncbi:MAG: FAD-binding protein [Rhodospirillales bacterium]|nr:FAD-binding protein [Rhodospirillales bacterium]
MQSIDAAIVGPGLRLMESADTIIVGAGSAGCVLAARLGEDALRRILVLEAGGQDKDWLLHLPIGFGKVWRAERYNWSYVSEPEPQLDGRRIFHPRGRVVGGSSSINVMAYVRCHRNDYDRWPQLGMKGWSFADVLPYFKRAESFADGGDAFHGDAGPLQTRRNRVEDPVFDAFLAAGAALGYPANDDYNGSDQAGFGRLQHTIGKGRRSSAATAYLRPAMRRGNIRLEVDAQVSRVVFEGNRAIGVEYLQHGTRRIVRAEREIILAGGAINSPQLLMLSGIGPGDRLREHGIDVRVDVPGVGDNLWDHPLVYTEYEGAAPTDFHRQLRFDRLALSLVQGALLGTGFATRMPATGTGFVRSAPDREIPDLQFYCRNGVLASREWFPLIQRPAPDGFALLYCHLRPQSRGSVTLASADPFARARIVNNFLATDYDVRAMREGMRLTQAMAATPEFVKLIRRRLMPKAALHDDDEIDAFVRQAMTTIYHPAGTCKIGIDLMAVVDPEFRVRGVDGLRVIDASVLPEPIGGNLNAPVIMLAEKASDILRGRPPLPPADL